MKRLVLIFGTVFLAVIVWRALPHSLTEPPPGPPEHAAKAPLLEAPPVSIDELALTIQLCGEPNRREQRPIHNRSGGEEAILYYNRRRTEIRYYRNQGQDRLWAYTAAFTMDGDDVLEQSALDRRMPCLQGKLVNPLARIRSAR